ncbi:MAG: hypothetical protein LAP40_09385 [Acidobacteriia bacterium]|nr:hypothetical protein [Terriglobia bacterium]
MIQRFLSVGDAERLGRASEKLGRHDTSPWALSGGLAIEIHRLRRGCRPSIRALNDLDFVADSFACIPGTLVDDFLFRHVHPAGPPGKLMLQFVDPQNALRVDVFRASGTTLNRTARVDLPWGPNQVVSLEDLTARAARIVLDLAEGVPVPSKHADDYLRLAELADPSIMETAWQDHRKPMHPTTFAEALRLIRELIPARSHLLINPEYSKDTRQRCSRCAPTAAFPLAEASVVLSVLGYC